VAPPENLLFQAPLPSRSAVSQDGRRIAYQASNSDVTILDLTSRGKVTTNCNTLGSMAQPSFSPDGNRLAFIWKSGTEQKVLSVDAATGTATQIAPDPKSPPPKKTSTGYLAAQAIPDGHVLYFRQSSDKSSSPRQVVVVNELCKDDAVLTVIPLSNDKPLHRAAICPNGKSLALMTRTFEWQGSGPTRRSYPVLAVRIYSIPSGALVGESPRYPGDTIQLPGDSSDIRFSPDGSRLAFVYQPPAETEKPVAPRMVALDTRSGKEFCVIMDLKSPACDLSPDGKLLARYDAEGRIVIEKLDGRKVLARYNPQEEDRSRALLPMLLFVSGGRKLLSFDGLMTGQLWDVPDPK
jgi:dipeptidyl aminopeptidase/acylaminoacyl peptidase